MNTASTTSVLNWDTDEAVRFLESFNPDGSWHPTAIEPVEGSIPTTQTFDVHQRQAIWEWIDARQNHRNLYFHVNALKLEITNKRAKKTDIGWVVALHVDIDVAPGLDADEELPKILDALQHFTPRPTVIIFSGGGYQAFWLLEAPQQIDGPEDIERLEAYNRGLEIALGGDHCHNVDRVMRLPGTVNLPNERKRKLGRVPALSYVVEAHWTHRYNLEEFTPVEATSPTYTSHRPKSTKTRDESRSGAAYRLAVKLYTDGTIKTYAEMVDALLAATDAGIAEWAHQKGDLNGNQRQLQRIWERVSNLLLLSAGSPLDSARRFLSDEYQDGKLIYHAQTYYEWGGTHYIAKDDDAIAAALCEFLEMAWQPTKPNNPPVPFNPTPNKISQIMKMLELVIRIDSSVTPPCWLDGREQGVFLACRNGLLRLPNEMLLPHSPNFFNTTALNFAYDPNPPEPTEWLNFLNSLWPGDKDEDDDTDSVLAVQEHFGYAISGDRSLQKIVLHIGPSRAGKGVMLRTLFKLMGGAAHASIRLSNFGTSEFGLQPLIGKMLAAVPDARLSGRSDRIVETLLAISGGDPLTVNRKYKNHVTLTLPTLIWMLSNTVPRLMDSSGVIASRFVVVQFRNSFLGREDPELENKLELELPGILKFAIQGYRALHKTGKFTQPKSGLTVYRALMRGASDIIAFIQDTHVLDPASQELTEQVYQKYVLWFTDTNQPGKPVSKIEFGKELTEAYPQISRVQSRVKGEYKDRRPYFYVGLRYHPHPDDED